MTAFNAANFLRNTAIGFETMSQGGESDPSDNTALGYKALRGVNHNDGDGNTAIGSNALTDLTTGSNNVAVGNGALSSRTDGIKNTAVGAVTLASNGGDQNTAVGYGALNIATGGSNTALGASAGDVISSGVNNTIIGKGSDPSANNATNQTVVGFAVTGVADNSVVLGNSAVTNVYMGSDSGAAVRCGTLISAPDEITATNSGVAASILTLSTEVTTNGDGDLDNVTLANGTSGQIKHIYCVVEGAGGDTWKITPATMCGGTQITFAGIGLGCTLVYADNEGWIVTGNNGGTIS